MFNQPANPLPVKVTHEPRRIVGESKLTIGVTHTRYSLDTGGDAGSIARSKAWLARAGCRYQNVHIMGWGTLNPNPAPGVYDWESLDKRMALVRSIPGAIPVITLCGCPDWMKGGAPGTTDWKRLEVAPLPAHYADFAVLAGVIARRYPHVRYFQVWNEMKGLWNAKINNWDYAGYTDLYNQVYDALKAANRRSQVGGPYFVVEGTGGGRMKTSDADAPPLSPRNLQVLDYWLQNKHGADFLTLDRGLTSFHDKNTYTSQEQMRLTRWFGAIEKQVRARRGAEKLPFWWAEFYASGKNMGQAEKTAINASAFRSSLLGGASVILMWQPMDTGEVGHALFTDARKPGGGQSLPIGDVCEIFNTRFGPGTKLAFSESSDPDVETLASSTHLLLINKRPDAIQVEISRNGKGTLIPLAPYQVRLLQVA